MTNTIYISGGDGSGEDGSGEDGSGDEMTVYKAVIDMSVDTIDELVQVSKEPTTNKDNNKGSKKQTEEPSQKKETMLKVSGRPKRSDELPLEEDELEARNEKMNKFHQNIANPCFTDLEKKVKELSETLGGTLETRTGNQFSASALATLSQDEQRRYSKENGWGYRDGRIICSSRKCKFLLKYSYIHEDKCFSFKYGEKQIFEHSCEEFSKEKINCNNKKTGEEVESNKGYLEEEKNSGENSGGALIDCNNKKTGEEVESDKGYLEEEKNSGENSGGALIDTDDDEAKKNEDSQEADKNKKNKRIRKKGYQPVTKKAKVQDRRSKGNKPDAKKAKVQDRRKKGDQPDANKTRVSRANKKKKTLPSPTSTLTTRTSPRVSTASSNQSTRSSTKGGNKGKRNQKRTNSNVNEENKEETSQMIETGLSNTGNNCFIISVMHIFFSESVLRNIMDFILTTYTKARKPKQSVLHKDMLPQEEIDDALQIDRLISAVTAFKKAFIKNRKGKKPTKTMLDKFLTSEILLVPSAELKEHSQNDAQVCYTTFLGCLNKVEQLLFDKSVLVEGEPDFLSLKGMGGATTKRMVKCEKCNLRYFKPGDDLDAGVPLMVNFNDEDLENKSFITGSDVLTKLFNTEDKICIGCEVCNDSVERKFIVKPVSAPKVLAINIGQPKFTVWKELFNHIGDKYVPPEFDIYCGKDIFKEGKTTDDELEELFAKVTPNEDLPFVLPTFMDNKEKLEKKLEEGISLGDYRVIKRTSIPTFFEKSIKLPWHGSDVDDIKTSVYDLKGVFHNSGADDKGHYTSSVVDETSNQWIWRDDERALVNTKDGYRQTNGSYLGDGSQWMTTDNTKVDSVSPDFLVENFDDLDNVDENDFKDDMKYHRAREITMVVFVRQD